MFTVEFTVLFQTTFRVIVLQILYFKSVEVHRNYIYRTATIEPHITIIHHGDVFHFFQANLQAKF